MNTKDTNRDHNAPVFYEDKNGKRPDTGLKKAALEDVNRRLVTDPNKQR